MKDFIFRILFVHPDEREIEKMKDVVSSLLEVELDTSSSLIGAKIYLSKKPYDMLFLNRKFDSDILSDFITYIENNYKKMECVLGVVTLSKADFIHYQNTKKKYRLYLEPVDYEKEIIPMIQNQIIISKAKILDRISDSVKDREKTLKEDMNLMLSLIDIKRNKKSRFNFYKKLIDLYHEIALSISNIEDFDDILSEINLLLKDCNIKTEFNIDIASSSLLKEEKEVNKRFNLLVIAVFLSMEASYLSEKDSKSTISFNIEMHDNGIFLSVKDKIDIKNIMDIKDNLFEIKTISLLIRHFLIDYQTDISKEESFLEITRDILI